MIAHLTILGKRRKLVGEPGNWFLANVKDVQEVNIYSALPLHLWEDDDYLNKIRPSKEQER